VLTHCVSVFDVKVKVVAEKWSSVDRSCVFFLVSALQFCQSISINQCKTVIVSWFAFGNKISGNIVQI